jgi:hypothetical protein
MCVDPYPASKLPTLGPVWPKIALSAAICSPAQSEAIQFVYKYTTQTTKVTRFKSEHWLSSQIRPTPDLAKV